MPLLYAVNSDGQPDRIISDAHYALRKSLIAPATFPPIGEVKALSMIVDYPDNTLKPNEATIDYWTEIFNGNGTWDQDRRSLQGVYLDHSFDKMKVTTTILWPPYRMKKNFADYNQDTHAQMIEAIKHYDPTFDFSPYDGNNDGYVDILFFLHSSYGPGDGKGCCIDYTADGVTFNDNIWQAVYSPWPPMGPGLCSHEFSHALDVPDFYDYNGVNSGQGNWCGGVVYYETPGNRSIYPHLSVSDWVGFGRRLSLKPLMDLKLIHHTKATPQFFKYQFLVDLLQNSFVWKGSLAKT